MATLLAVARCAPQLTDAQLEKSLNDRLVMHRYLRCATGEGPCDASGRRLRCEFKLFLCIMKYYMSS